jgi:predicted GNAT family N-acyltransferase
MIREIAFGSSLYNAMARFREDHLRRPLGLANSADDLAGEDRQVHIAAVEGDAILGTVILKPVSASLVKLRQMAVAPQTRGQGLGRDLMLFAEKIARQRGYREIEMHARVSAKGFYEKLGYRAVGDEFVEVTVPHVAMTKPLSLPA